MFFNVFSSFNTVTFFQFLCIYFFFFQHCFPSIVFQICFIIFFVEGTFERFLQTSQIVIFFVQTVLRDISSKPFCWTFFWDTRSGANVFLFAFFFLYPKHVRSRISFTPDAVPHLSFEVVKRSPAKIRRQKCSFLEKDTHTPHTHERQTPPSIRVISPHQLIERRLNRGTRALNSVVQGRDALSNSINALLQHLSKGSAQPVQRGVFPDMRQELNYIGEQKRPAGMGGERGEGRGGSAWNARWWRVGLLTAKSVKNSIESMYITADSRVYSLINNIHVDNAPGVNISPETLAVTGFGKEREKKRKGRACKRHTHFLMLVLVRNTWKTKKKEE